MKDSAMMATAWRLLQYVRAKARPGPVLPVTLQLASAD